MLNGTHSAGGAPDEKMVEQPEKVRLAADVRHNWEMAKKNQDFPLKSIRTLSLGLRFWRARGRHRHALLAVLAVAEPASAQTAAPVAARMFRALFLESKSKLWIRIWVENLDKTGPAQLGLAQTTRVPTQTRPLKRQTEN